ncbi:PREDICTED: uncharacterized protein LOC109153926 [Ipomoea nil]|uniref:uncharacterized protein LOC109153926 n=1 Tax=Ipomoea nil TaxID=35883 RepID=UPI000901DED2|nr:PREDICTED: uncharacterized protein LOC109153926 [Ipomoea nil]
MVDCDEICPLCNAANESIFHILVDCTFARTCWRPSGVHLSGSSDHSFSNWVNHNIPGMDIGNLSLVVIICWEIWKQRNAKLWNNSSTLHEHQLIRMAKSFLGEWKEATHLIHPSSHSDSIPSHKWTRPQPGMMKMNVDATLNSSGAAMGLGCVIRDEDGTFIVARGVQWKDTFTPRETEAVAIREALSWLKAHNFDNL